MVETAFNFREISVEDLGDENPDLKSFLIQAYDEIRNEVEEYGPEVAPPQLEVAVDKILFICDLPVIEEAKTQKFVEILSKILSKYLPGTKYDIEIPFNPETKKSYGFALLNFQDKEQTQSAKALLNGIKWKKHVFKVITYAEAERIENMADEYTSPVIHSEADLKSWNLDMRDMFLVRDRMQYSLNYNDYQNDKSVEVCKEGDIDPEVSYFWSSKGSFLYNVDNEGIKIRGGPELKILYELSHPWAQHALISHTEQYAVTHSYNINSDVETYTVWNMNTGEDLRSFVSEGSSWGNTQWSHDDQFIARLVTDKISIYDSATMSMLEDGQGNKKSLDIPNVSTMAWSPTDNLLAYTVAPKGQIPGQIRIVRLPGREQVSSKAIKNFSACHLEWQKNGNHMIAIIDRMNKAGNITKGVEMSIFYANRGGTIPSELIPLTKHKNALDFSWEHEGNHFGVVYKDGANHFVQSYEITDRIVPLNSMQTWGKKVKWSPKGGSFVTVDDLNFEFFRVRRGTVSQVSSQNVNACNYFEWDSSGRFLVVANLMSQFARSGSRVGWTGFTIFNCQGTFLYTFKLDEMIQFTWRPRAKPLVSRQEVEGLQKGQKKLNERFANEDKERESAKTEKQAAEKQARIDRFNRAVESRKKKLQEITWESDYTSALQGRYETEVEIRIPIKN